MTYLLLVVFIAAFSFFKMIMLNLLSSHCPLKVFFNHPLVSFELSRSAFSLNCISNYCSLHFAFVRPCFTPPKY